METRREGEKGIVSITSEVLTEETEKNIWYPPHESSKTRFSSSCNVMGSVLAAF